MIALVVGSGMQALRIENAEEISVFRLLRIYAEKGVNITLRLFKKHRR